MSVKEDLEVEFKVMKYNNSDIISRKYFEDKNERWWGEYISYYESGQIYRNGFCFNHLYIGVWTRYRENGSLIEKRFYSFETPGKNIDENEYKRQLVKIRLGILKVPVLDLKICDYER